MTTYYCVIARDADGDVAPKFIATTLADALLAQAEVEKEIQNSRLWKDVDIYSARLYPDKISRRSDGACPNCGLADCPGQYRIGGCSFDRT